MISKALFDTLESDGEKLTQLINGYIGYLKKSKQGQNEPGANHMLREDSFAYNLDIPKTPQPANPIPDSQITIPDLRLSITIPMTCSIVIRAITNHSILDVCWRDFPSDAQGCGNHSGRFRFHGFDCFHRRIVRSTNCAHPIR